MKIRQLSRFVDAKDARETKAALATGDVDIVVGTHALLAKSIEFKNLGLVIVDEEQHFGVVHKERLKSLKADVHVLTLTATPIPRTLQLALSGVRDLSLITTPPVDRLAVRTFVTPFDPLVIREALLREHYRGGQSFYVCPRIADLREAQEFLKETVPEVKVAVGHGQMAPSALEDVMTAFYDGKMDVLISTNIVESGLDIPTANTLIVHRADMFGLSQLYQLRGRIGRSKQRAYAYLTTPGRPEVDRDGRAPAAGAAIARPIGRGVLGGEPRSRYPRRGQSAGRRAIRPCARSGHRAVPGDAGGSGLADAARWRPVRRDRRSMVAADQYRHGRADPGSLCAGPQCAHGALSAARLDRRTRNEIERFAAELIDRFGALPEEVQHLLKVVAIKSLCRVALVEKIDAGPKGATLTFRNNTFPNPIGLVRLIGAHASTMKVRPDQKVVIARSWPEPEDRLKGAQSVLTQLAKLAEAA